MNQPDPLSDVLARWQPAPGPAPDFAAEVHARIAAAPPSTARPSLMAQILAWPASLPLAAAFAVVIGVASALTVSRSRNQAIMADAYARSIDPIHLATTNDHTGHSHAP